MAVTNPGTQGAKRVYGMVSVDSITDPVTVTGTVAIDTTGLATSAAQATGNTSLSSILTALSDILTELGNKLDAGGSVTVSSAPTTAVTGTFWQATQPVSGTVTANPSTGFGKTITYVAVAQEAAGTTELAAASGSNKHKVVGGMLTMSLAGTLKFTDGVADLTGPMTFAANGGMVVPESPVPFTQTGAVNRALNLVTTLGAANGVVAILTEP